MRSELSSCPGRCSVLLHGWHLWIPTCSSLRQRISVDVSVLTLHSVSNDTSADAAGKIRQHVSGDKVMGKESLFC